MKVFIVFEVDIYSLLFNTDFTLKNCLFEAVKLTKYADLDKYSYSGYCIGLDSRSLFLISNFDFD